MLRKWNNEFAQSLDQVLLVAITGVATFASIAPAPSVSRLAMVSPPAMFLLAWLVNQPGTVLASLKAILITSTIIVSVAAPIHFQMRWRAYFDLPAGRVALDDPALFEQYSWVLKHTHPGQFFWGMPPLYLPFHLRNPAPIDAASTSDYTRPDHVVSVVQALEVHRPPLLILSHLVNPLESEAPSSDHLEPLRAYLRRNYRLTKTFPSNYEAWERIDSGASNRREPVDVDAR
jgi:hypothetical protein